MTTRRRAVLLGGRDRAPGSAAGPPDGRSPRGRGAPPGRRTRSGRGAARSSEPSSRRRSGPNRAMTASRAGSPRFHDVARDLVGIDDDDAGSFAEPARDRGFAAADGSGEPDPERPRAGRCLTVRRHARSVRAAASSVGAVGPCLVPGRRRPAVAGPRVAATSCCPTSSCRTSCCPTTSCPTSCCPTSSLPDHELPRPAAARPAVARPAELPDQRVAVPGAARPAAARRPRGRPSRPSRTAGRRCPARRSATTPSRGQVIGAARAVQAARSRSEDGHVWVAVGRPAVRAGCELQLAAADRLGLAADARRRRWSAAS